MRMINASDGRAAVLRALKQSGLSMAEFCRRRGLGYATVASWRSAARRQRTRGFVEVETDGGAAPESASGAALCVELTLPGGAVLRVFQRGAQGGSR